MADQEDQVEVPNEEQEQPEEIIEGEGEIIEDNQENGKYLISPKCPFLRFFQGFSDLKNLL